MSVDAKQVGIRIGIGMATAASVLGAVSVIGLPVSYVANRFIYHSKGMRALLVIVTAILSIFILPVMLIYQTVTWGGLAKAHYFGYLPFIMKESADAKAKPTEDTGEVGWFMPAVIAIWTTVRDFLFGGLIDHRELSADQAAFSNSVETMLVDKKFQGDPKYVVIDVATKLAQAAATEVTTPEQASVLEMLQKLAQGLSLISEAPQLLNLLRNNTPVTLLTRVLGLEKMKQAGLTQRDVDDLELKWKAVLKELPPPGKEA
jgi:hypothetical protein